MGKSVSAYNARRDFGRILREVADKGNQYIVERHGEQVAAIVPLKVLEWWEAERKAMFDTMRKAAANANMSPEEADRLAEKAVRAVRAKKARAKAAG